MMTIKHVAPSGNESVHPADEVSFLREQNPETVMYRTGDTWNQITDGTVYVMNDRGTTVATYRPLDRLGYPADLDRLQAQYPEQMKNAGKLASGVCTVTHDSDFATGTNQLAGQR